ncbi:probable amino-acid racemase, partial [Tanacetum coccineum]
MDCFGNTDVVKNKRGRPRKIVSVDPNTLQPKKKRGRPTVEVNIEKEKLMRFIVMGQKSLPDPTSKKKGRPYWGFVKMVTTNIQDIKDALKGEEYETKTRGHRHKPPTRALGEGVYRIL